MHECTSIVILVVGDEMPNELQDPGTMSRNFHKHCPLLQQQQQQQQERMKEFYVETLSQFLVCGQPHDNPDCLLVKGLWPHGHVTSANTAAVLST